MNQSDSAEPPDKESHSNRMLIRRLLRLSWEFRGRCLQVLFFQLVVLVMGLSTLGLTGLAIDYLRHTLGDAEPPRWPFGVTPPSEWTPMTVILCIAGLATAFALLQAVFNYALKASLGRLTHVEIVASLRSRVFRKLQRLSFRFFDENASGSIINRVTGDVQAVRMFIDQVLIQVFIMALSLAVYLVYMLNIHVWLTLACLATTPLLWFLSASYSKVMRPAYLRNRELMDDMVLGFSETVSGIQTVKAFALENERLDQFGAQNTAIREQRWSIFRKVSTFGPVIGFITQLNLFILLIYGGYLVYQGELPVGTGIVVFAGLLQQFSGQISNIAGLADSIQQSLAGARRVFEIVDAPVEIESPPDPVPLKNARGAVRFEHVDFHYERKSNVLRDLSFDVRPGEVIAIAGATGAGKSALMSLIPRFFDPTSGCVRLDGHDLRELDLEDLRRNVGFVFQENFLFSNTIAENIAFGNPDASPGQIEKAARIACAHDFIMEMPGGYDAILGESGVNLSGGQRQRLAIARAILPEPAILLLDDPTASIDPETEDEILNAIERAIEGRTTFIVAHRLSTLKRADRVLVLENGRLIQSGTHQALMEEAGPYRQAIEMQAVDPESWAILSRMREAPADGGPAPDEPPKHERGPL
ncbi:MAG: ABC transporter ATP-binding protein [Verrucomicrobiota bacterium]